MSPNNLGWAGRGCRRLDPEADTLPYCQLESDLGLKLNVQKATTTTNLPSVLCLFGIVHSYLKEENGFDIALGKGKVENICF